MASDPGATEQRFEAGVAAEAGWARTRRRTAGRRALALDEHGNAAAWVKRYPGGGTFVRYWGRMRRLSDPAVVVKLAEHEMP